MWWLLANLVLAVHILLWLFLGVGVVVTATGWMRRHHKLALFFWSTAFVTLGSMAAPGCILSDVERWLRNLEVPGWRREMSLARTISGILTGYHPPEAVFTALGILLCRWLSMLLCGIILRTFGRGFNEPIGERR